MYKASVVMVLAGLGLGEFAFMYYSDSKFKKYCFSSSAVPQSYSIERRNIDQVVQDHDGYRIWNHDPVDSEMHEEFFFPEGSDWSERTITPPILPPLQASLFSRLGKDHHFYIFKDLDDGQQPYALILKYRAPGCRLDLTHLEVHLPRNQGIAAGIDSWIEGKVKKYEPMNEIK